MNPRLAKRVLRIIGAITVLAGLLCVYAFIAACMDVFLHIWVRPAISDIVIELLITLGGIAFGAYIVYLGYQISCQFSRRAFERIYFGTAIFLAVIVGRNVSGFLFYLIPVGIGLIVLFTRPLVSNRIFPEDN
jgi:hypothetical protein